MVSAGAAGLLFAFDATETKSDANPAARSGSRLQTPSSATERPSLTVSPSLPPLPTSSPSPGGSSPPTGCATWPAAMQQVLARLPVPERVCLKIAEHRTEMPLFCQGSAGCYDPATRTVWQVTNAVELLPKTPPFLGVERSFLLAHELCHAHQQYMVIREKGESAARSREYALSWLETGQGREFVAVERQLSYAYFPLVQHPVENFASLCAAWLLVDESMKEQWIYPWPTLRAYFTRWLPGE
jgi:hypothetical protein